MPMCIEPRHGASSDVPGDRRCRRHVRVRGGGRCFGRGLASVGWCRLGRTSDHRIVLAGLHPRYRVTRAGCRLRRICRRRGGRRRERRGIGDPRVRRCVDHRPHQQHQQQQPRPSGGQYQWLLVVPAAVVITAHGWNVKPSGPASPWPDLTARAGEMGRS